MQITASTPRVEKTYAGIKFQVPQFYGEGYVLTATDAAGVNNLVSQRLGNSQAGAIRRELQAMYEANVKLCKAKDPAAKYDEDEKGKRVPHKFTIDELPARDWQEEFDDLATEWELGVSSRGTGGGASDPIERLTRTLASEAVKAGLKARGYNIRSIMLAKSTDGTQSKLAELVDAYIAKYPALRETAKAQLASTDNGAGDDDVFGDLPQAEAA